VRVVCQAIREREAMVEYLALHIPHLEVVWESERYPSVWACWRRAITAAGEEGFLHIEDDVTLTVDFLAKAEAAVGDGSVMTSFFSLTGKQGARAGRDFLMTQACWLPPRWGLSIAAELRRNPVVRGSGYDSHMALWMASKGLGWWSHQPDLVQHTRLPSTLGARSTFRQSPTFRDPELRGHPHPDLVVVDGVPLGSAP